MGAGQDHHELDRLLGEMALHPEARGDYCDEIDRLFGEDAAVMVLDMSGFSRTTQRCGIVEGLLMTWRMRSLAAPLIAERQGRIVKSEADNLYCLFRDVCAAIDASLAIRARMEAENCALGTDQRLYASIGIGYGRVLNIGGADFYGDEVNLTSKLAEDIAGRGEILLTSSALAAAYGDTPQTEQAACTVSGMELVYFRTLCPPLAE
jgi:class 3 adenylate cyclase